MCSGISSSGSKYPSCQSFVAAVTCYACEITLEIIGAWSENRQPAFLGGGWKKFIIFLLPAHITGMATGMLIYDGDHVLPFIFGAAVAIASKAIFTVTVHGKRRHILNPSNTGIVATVFLFPSVGAVYPWQFTQGLNGFWQWALPAIFIAAGTFLNSRFPKEVVTNDCLNDKSAEPGQDARHFLGEPAVQKWPAWR